MAEEGGVSGPVPAVDPWGERAGTARPQPWTGRARIPMAPPPATAVMPPVVVVPVYVRRRRRGGFRRFVTGLFWLAVIAAVPVVSTYVAYKLASGENPFQWPPSMDLSHVF